MRRTVALATSFSVPDEGSFARACWKLVSGPLSSTYTNMMSITKNYPTFAGNAHQHDAVNHKLGRACKHSVDGRCQQVGRLIAIANNNRHAGELGFQILFLGAPLGAPVGDRTHILLVWDPCSHTSVGPVRGSQGSVPADVLTGKLPPAFIVGSGALYPGTNKYVTVSSAAPMSTSA